MTILMEMATLDAGFKRKFIHLINPAERIGIKGFVNNITPMNSKATDFIQVIDVIMGAIGFLQNGLFRRDNAKKAKVKMMKYIFEKMTLSGAIFVSGKTYYVAKSTKFNGVLGAGSMPDATLVAGDVTQ